MTLEMKIKRMLDEYDDGKEALAREYREKFDNRSVNSFGEVSASETLEINQWYVQKSNELQNKLAKEFESICKVPADYWDKDGEEDQGRTCEVCGEKITQGFTDDWGEFYCCEDCFEKYLNKTYGEGKWKSSGGEESGENGGFYIATIDDGKTWFDTGAYWTEWEEG